MIEISFYGIIVVIKTYIVGKKIFLFLLREEINSISALNNFLHTQKSFGRNTPVYHEGIDFKKHGCF